MIHHCKYEHTIEKEESTSKVKDACDHLIMKVWGASLALPGRGCALGAVSIEETKA
jgi:hypothetical protein